MHDGNLGSRTFEPGRGDPKSLTVLPERGEEPLILPLELEPESDDDVDTVESQIQIFVDPHPELLRADRQQGTGAAHADLWLVTWSAMSV